MKFEKLKKAAINLSRCEYLLYDIVPERLGQKSSSTKIKFSRISDSRITPKRPSTFELLRPNVSYQQFWVSISFDFSM